MNALGVYFGSQIISMVETKNRMLINNVRILRALISTGETLEEKVPEEIKMIPFIKDELKKNRIEADEVTVGLSGKDLIIRTFEMPVLPRQELDSAINFEVKKYIPFKVEDLVSDFQYKLDKANKRNYVLFVGIKKDILSKYLSIFNQLGIKVKAIEYSAFSTLRFLTLSGIRERGIVAVVNLDLNEEDEVNFVVLENGFPLFSRDITFSRESPKVSSGETQAGIVLEKLKREIRISLDYYDRTFPLKNINKVFFIMDSEHRLELENFIKEIGFGVQFINVHKCIGKPVSFSLSFIKGYSTSISKVDTALKIDLLSAKEKAVKKISPEPTKKMGSLIENFKSQLMVPAICLLAWFLTYMAGVYRLMPLRKDLDRLKVLRPAVTTIAPDKTYDELTAVEQGYRVRIKTLDSIVKKRLLLTQVLDVIPRALPKGMRLTELFYGKEENKAELVLRGTASLGDSVKELDLVNYFLSQLKQDPSFSQYFKDVTIQSIDNAPVKGVVFTISCKGYQ